MYVWEEENACGNLITAIEVGILITGGAGVSGTGSLLAPTSDGS